MATGHLVQSRSMSISKEQLRDLLEFVRWADGQIIMASRTVEDEAYFKDQGISLGSIHKLQVHMMAAQWIWLCRWRGEFPTRIENHEDFPSRDSVEQRWPLVHSAIFDFLGLQSPKSLSREIQYRNLKGDIFCIPLGELMMHVIDHSAYHRGQINTMIRKCGGTPAAVSYVNYYLHRNKATV